MKFGEYLLAHQEPDWAEYYIKYDALKKIIKQMEDLHLGVGVQQSTEIGTSLSVPRPTNAAGRPLSSVEQEKLSKQEDFFATLESEMKKIEKFTKQQVETIRSILRSVEAQISRQELRNLPGSLLASQLQQQIESSGELFLKLEKYVNLNFTGFSKILKKHDRRLPNPCRSFYLGRLHQQSWVRGDFSDVIVIMSRAYSALRGDQEAEAKESEKQDFVRSTRKYWVHTEDVSRVKYIVLQHLPVFVQKSMDGCSDSQLVNSVYLDNSSMELYHGRLDKTPGAIALRMRWYGTGNPETVFVERKTHRESWCGEVSVKERFTVQENQVQSLIDGTFDLGGELDRMRTKGKSEEAIREWEDLATEVLSAIQSKQLFPTMRTQYMRTAFQIPFDATVRISLDTNLTMICERTKDVSDGKRWYRDPNVTVPLNEITRFPHAVLEVKLQLEEDGKTPVWVQELLDSGMLLEVHKFSKFIHGCAVLMTDDVVAVPYWIDDATLAQSIFNSGGNQLFAGKSAGANVVYNHLLPHDAAGKSKPVPESQLTVGGDEETGLLRPGSAKKAAIASSEPKTNYGTSSVVAGSRQYGQEEEAVERPDNVCIPGWCEWADRWESERMTTQKVEPKLFLANERTFIKWLQMAVVLSSISTAILAFSSSESSATYVALALLPLSLLFLIYGYRQYTWRSTIIRTRDTSRWDDVLGPVTLTLILIIALLAQFTLSLIRYIGQADASPSH